MNYFNTFFKSLFSPRSYDSFLRRGFGFSFSFFWLTTFLYSLIFSIVMGLNIYSYDLHGAVQSGVTHFPSDFALAVDNEGWTINKPLPYSLDLDPHFRILFSDENSMEDVYGDYQIVLTPDYIYYQDGNYYDSESNANRPLNYRMYPLANMLSSIDETFVLDRENLVGYVERAFEFPLLSSKVYALLIAVVVLIFSFIFLSLGALILDLIFSLIVWLIAMITASKKQLSYGKIFQIALHSTAWLVVFDALSKIPVLQFLTDDVKHVFVFVWMVVIVFILPNVNFKKLKQNE